MDFTSQTKDGSCHGRDGGDGAPRHAQAAASHANIAYGRGIGTGETGDDLRHAHVGSQYAMPERTLQIAYVYRMSRSLRSLLRGYVDACTFTRVSQQYTTYVHAYTHFGVTAVNCIRLEVSTWGNLLFTVYCLLPASSFQNPVAVAARARGCPSGICAVNWGSNTGR